MKKENANNRTKIIGLRLNKKEFDVLLQQASRTTTPILSEFVRRVIFEKPITMKQRNQSLDDFMSEMMQLRTELTRLGNNFNQAVKKLHTLVQLSEFRAWLNLYETNRQLLQKKIEAIELKIS